MPQQSTPYLAPIIQLKSPELRASALSVPALESFPSPPPCSLVSYIPLESQPYSVLPSYPAALDLTTDTLYNSLTDSIKSSQTAIGPEKESPEAFFTAALEAPEEKRVKRLSTMVQRLSKAEEPSNRLYKKFWSKQSRIFQPGPGLIPEMKFEAQVAYRLRRLNQARQNIDEGD